MFFVRLYIILVSSVLVFSGYESFASSSGSTANPTVSRSGSTATGRVIKPKVVTAKTIETQSGKIDTQSGKIDTTISPTDDDSIVTKDRNTQDLILEVYKIQGNKILKDIDQNLERINPDPGARTEAYTAIQKTLQLRKQRIKDDDTIEDESRIILIAYIDYMVTTIERKKRGLN